MFRGKPKVIPNGIQITFKTAERHPSLRCWPFDLLQLHKGGEKDLESTGQPKSGTTPRFARITGLSKNSLFLKLKRPGKPDLNLNNGIVKMQQLFWRPRNTLPD